MAGIIGHVGIGLDKGATTAEFSQLQGIVAGEVAKLKPVTLKLDVAGTTKEFGELSKVIKEVASNINKINMANIGGGDAEQAQKARERAQAYKEVTREFQRLQHYQQSAAKLDTGKDPFGMENAVKKLDEYRQKFNEVFNANKNKLSSSQIDDLNYKYRVLNETLDEINAKQTDKALAQVNAAAAKEQAQAIKEQAQAQREAAAAEKERSGGLSDLENRILSMVSLTAILTASIRQMKQMVTTTIELDSAMTQLRIVTNNSEAEYAAYGAQVAKTSQEIGASMTDIVDSTTVFARLGYSLSESSGLSRLTAMLHNVGDIDVSSAQNALTAITKAFSDAGSDIELAMDKMVTVGNNFPISVAELAEGMNNAGSALAAAGNSFDQSIALLTAANVTVQNVSKSSTGLRTIAARIRKTTTELNDLGEVVNEAKYQQVIDLLTGNGVKLTENGEYRATYDILKDIADIWDRLSSMDQAAIAEQLAGNRQQNVFYSIIGQFREAENAMVAMQNSQGAMAAANDEFMNSIQAHINSFQSAYQQLAATVADADVTKNIVDFGTAAINVLTRVFELLDKIGGALPVLSGIGSALFSHFAGLVGGKLLDITGITKIAEAIKTAATAAGGLKALGAKGAIGTLLGALTTPGKIGLIVAGVTALTSLFTYFATKPRGLEKAIADVEEYTSQLENAEAKYTENENRILELSRVRGTSSWTAQLEVELNSLIAQNTALETQKELLEQRNAAAKEVEHSEALKRASELSSTGDPSTRSLLDIYGDYSHAIKTGNTRAQDTWSAHLIEALDEAVTVREKLDPKTDADAIAALDAAINKVNTSLGMTSKAASDASDAMDELTKLGAGGNVNLTNRPVLNAADLRSAGWNDIADGIATLYTSTYSGKNDTIAINFTPIIADPETGEAIGLMTPEALDEYAFGVIDGVHDDYLNLQIGAEFTGEDAIDKAGEAAQRYHELHEQIYEDSQAISGDTLAIVSAMPSVARNTREALDALLGSEDFEKQYESLVEMSKSLNGISASNISDLAGKSSELADILRIDGMNAEFLAFVLQKELTTGNGIDLITDKALRLNSIIGQIQDRLENAAADLRDYSEATQTEKGDVAAQYVSAYQQFQKDWESGRTGTNAVEAAVKLILSDDALADLDYDLQAAGEMLSSSLYKSIFNADGDPGYNFVKYIKDNYNDALDGIVEITEGNGTFNFAISSVEALADAFDMDVDAVHAFLDAMDAFGVQVMMTGEEAGRLAEELGLVGNASDNLTKVESAVSQLASIGKDSIEIRGIIDSLVSAGYIDTSEIDNLGEIIQNAISQVKGLDEAEAKPEVTVETSAAEENVNRLKSLIDSVQSKEVTLTVNHIDHYSSTGSSGVNANALGTKSSPGGRTLVNELGPELISENGHAYIANGGEPAIVNLSKGAVVLNAKETRKIAGISGVGGSVKAYAAGTPVSATFPNFYGGGSGGGGSSKSSSKSSSSSSSSDSSSKKEKTWFEKQYDYHKHLVEMDQELQSDFLDWLDEAYKKAYAEGIIDLEEYMQREEEVYKGRQDQFKDYISDLDYAIDMAKRAGANSEDVANMYQKMLDEINRALEIAFARGLDENDDYVQYLQNQWYNYYDNLKEAREDAQDDAMDAVDDLVQYRIKMLKQYIKNEVDALKERLSNLKDFYSKQKDLLKDVADTEDYLDEQAEKRKSVTDIESQLAMLDLDNSAWAQKRKAKLKEELADAQKELNKFERDHAIEVASDQLDAAYEVQERAINARIDELNDLADNPKALYDKALSDVRNNSVALYEEMIEFNNKYGLIPWLLHKVICVNNHTYMRGHLKAIYQNGWLRHQDGWCESRKNIWIAYGATLSA